MKRRGSRLSRMLLINLSFGPDVRSSFIPSWIHLGHMRKMLIVASLIKSLYLLHLNILCLMRKVVASCPLRLMRHKKNRLV